MAKAPPSHGRTQSMPNAITKVPGQPLRSTGRASMLRGASPTNKVKNSPIRQPSGQDRREKHGHQGSKPIQGKRLHSAGTRHAWVVFGVACCIALIIIAVSFPFHALVEQHVDIAQSANEVKVLTQQEHALSSEVKKLQDPQYISELAHRDYGLVKPGEKEYFVAPLPGLSGPSSGLPHQLDGTMPPGAFATNGSSNSSAASAEGAKSATGLSLWARVLRHLEFWKSD